MINPGLIAQVITTTKKTFSPSVFVPGVWAELHHAEITFLLYFSKIDGNSPSHLLDIPKNIFGHGSEVDESPSFLPSARSFNHPFVPSLTRRRDAASRFVRCPC